MAKRGRLEIIKDILLIVNSQNPIKITPLIRKSNLSSSKFKEYYREMLKKEFIKEITNLKSKSIFITHKGIKFLEKYKTIINFIDEFEL